MKEGKLCIKLLSDLCVSDGGVYNSALDTDICQDSYGFPYIPGKRLRGCLREAAIELMEWGVKIEPQALFGDEGDSRSKIFIGNAYPKDYGNMLKAVKGVNNRIYHKQNILNHFSYIRSQTAINYETGVADATSLRTMRVANKGTVFEAPIQYDEQYRNALVRCANILRHMGVARTRGLGEVEVQLIDECIPQEQIEKHADYVEGSTRLDFTISTIDPVVFKSINGGEANTHDYIEGSRTLGIIAEYLKTQGIDYQNFIQKGNLQVSHAFICKKGKRYTETPAAFYNIKNNYSDYRNKLYDTVEHREEDRNLQLNPMKHGYVYCDEKTGALDQTRVLVEERYHHRRPDDKAIGRANPSDPKSVFYQISSICSDQKFKGFITGSKEQIKTAYKCFTSSNEFRMGAGRSSEYGRVSIHVDDVAGSKNEITTEVKKFAVKLVSPAIVYNDKAFYSVNSKDLVDEISKLFGFDSKEAAVSTYTKFVTLGGWNVTWGKRKPVVQAFDKGSVITFAFENARKITIPGNFTIGERRIEGFGELEFIKISETDNYKGKLKTDENSSCEESVDVSSSDFAEEIAKDLFMEFMRAEASVNAASYFSKKDSDKKATVSDLTLMLKELPDEPELSVITQIENNSIDRYDTHDEGKAKKKRIANEILRRVSECLETLQDKFSETYNVVNFRYDKGTMEKEFLLAYLTYGKYIMHKNDGSVSKEGDTANA